MTGTDGTHCSWRFYPGVRQEIKDLGAEGAGLVGEAIRLYGKGQALPRQVSPLVDGIYEIRVSVRSNQYRLFFFHPLPFIAVGLVAFYKNTKKTPPHYITRAKDRKKTWRSADRV